MPLAILLPPVKRCMQQRASRARTYNIDGIFMNGRQLARPALDRHLDYAAQQARRWRANSHTLGAAVRNPLLRIQFAD